MNQAPFHFTCDASPFIERITKLAAVSGHTMEEELMIQGRLLSSELMKRTPPFSGRDLKRMLTAQGKSLNDDVEDLTAKKMGERRVEKDIRSLVYGVKNTGKGTSQAQRVQGRDAIRLFSKGGEAYGIEVSKFLTSAQQIKQVHDSHRNRRGRVTGVAKGQSRQTGTWHWLNNFAAPEAILAPCIKAAQQKVGEGKSGWATGYHACGGKISSGGWIGRHMKRAGFCNIKKIKDGLDILIVNQSAWASGGDDDRIMDKSLERRAEACANRIDHILHEAWEKTQR